MTESNTEEFFVPLSSNPIYHRYKSSPLDQGTSGVYNEFINMESMFQTFKKDSNFLSAYGNENMGNETPSLTLATSAKVSGEYASQERQTQRPISRPLLVAAILSLAISIAAVSLAGIALSHSSSSSSASSSSVSTAVIGASTSGGNSSDLSSYTSIISSELSKAMYNETSDIRALNTTLLEVQQKLGNLTELAIHLTALLSTTNSSSNASNTNKTTK